MAGYNNFQYPGASYPPNPVGFEAHQPYPPADEPRMSYPMAETHPSRQYNYQAPQAAVPPVNVYPAVPESSGHRPIAADDPANLPAVGFEGVNESEEPSGISVGDVSTYRVKDVSCNGRSL